jgi:hypothetical protein
MEIDNLNAGEWCRADSAKPKSKLAVDSYTIKQRESFLLFVSAARVTTGRMQEHHADALACLGGPREVVLRADLLRYCERLHQVSAP